MYPKAILKFGKEDVGSGTLPKREGCSAGMAGKRLDAGKAPVESPEERPVTGRIGKGDGCHGRLNESSFIISVQ